MSSQPRICVIYNPAARGGNIRRLRERLKKIGARCAFKPTQAPGDGIRLATEAVNEGFEIVASGGGDGTMNEVVNGIVQAPEGLRRTALGVLPLGTVNVFAKELRLPTRLEQAWRRIETGTTREVDLGVAIHNGTGPEQRRYFVQLGGAGLDARAIELVDWHLKRRILQFAYVVAGFQALFEKHQTITCEHEGGRLSGELVLIGNGRFYGGRLPVFPRAELDDGLLHAAVFARVNLWTVFRFGLGLLFKATWRPSNVTWVAAKALKLSAPAPVPFELEGDLVGRLPARFFLHDERLRVIC